MKTAVDQPLTAENRPEILQVLEKKLDWHHVAVRAYHPETDQVELLALNQPGISAAQNKKQVERLNRMIRTPDQGLERLGDQARGASPLWRCIRRLTIH